MGEGGGKPLFRSLRDLHKGLNATSLLTYFVLRTQHDATKLQGPLIVYLILAVRYTIFWVVSIYKSILFNSNIIRKSGDAVS